MSGKQQNDHVQESERPSRDGPGRPSNPYKSGANVGNKSGPEPSKEAPASQPHKQTY